MSNNESTPADEVQAWRDRAAAYRHEVYEGHGFHGWDFTELDAYDMMGFNGAKLDPPPQNLTPKQIEDGEMSHNANAVEDARGDNNYDNEWQPWRECIGEQWGGPYGIARHLKPLLGKLAAHTALEAVEPITKAMDELREPIRTVAINCLVFDKGVEEVASTFGLSLQTVEFLCDVALDLLASHIHFD
jgi:hypothetical protein